MAEPATDALRPATGEADTTLPEQGAVPAGTFHAFRYPNYRLLWLGNAFTATAQWVQNTTMGWVVYDLTGSGSMLGAVNGMRIIPTLVLSPVAGVVTDRFSRNRVIAVSQVALFTFTFALATGLALHAIDVWHLFLFAFLVAVANTFNMPARQTMVFDVVPRAVIPNAVALSNVAMSVSRTLGPMVGGLLIVWLGPANNFYLQGCAYLAVMVTVLQIPLPPRDLRRQRRSFFRSMADGYAFAARDPQARLLLLMSVISPLFLIPMHNALLPIFAKRVFQSDAAGLGILLAAIGAGGVLGGVLAASLSGVDRRGLVQLAALLVFSLSQALFAAVGAATGNLLASLPLLVLAGVAESVFNTTNQTVLQLVAPDHLRGRMASVLQVGPLLIPVGSLAAGTLADSVGAPLVGMGFSFIAFAIGLVVLVCSPRMRALRLSGLAQR